ncbi:MAG: hypothetical protein ACTSPH_08430 [Promethearchaeota archaeon]
MTPSAPRPIARIIKDGVTLPVQLILIGRIVEGYCALIVPAISPAPYPHFQHIKVKIFIALSDNLFHLFIPLLI